MSSRRFLTLWRPCLPRAIQSSVLGSWNSVMANAVNSQDLTHNGRIPTKHPHPQHPGGLKARFQSKRGAPRTSVKPIGVFLERNMSSHESRPGSATLSARRRLLMPAGKATPPPPELHRRKPRTQAYRSRVFLSISESGNHRGRKLRQTPVCRGRNGRLCPGFVLTYKQRGAAEASATL